ncbi:MAG: MaoC family dehydratase [Pseudobdellovibrio sp.]
MKIGDKYQEEIKITDNYIKKFADFCGDFNPVHFDDEKAKEQGFKGRIAHGMVSASFFSKIFANTFPGPGAVYLNQTLKFHAPVYLDETLQYRLEVITEKEGKPIYTVKTEAFGPDNTIRISGEAIIRFQK